ncbi:hypothetical protein GMRT_13240 [Giardia muris]|uniref:Uncharacterized protein n=1 Tax=Giardia muris TaxID=5742 RepID=A0A4Z1SS55_GIAMU|nr:hypothetical protein GMRT_13240 [Giardia muris]|eukprot:TNJ28714.1 hypothetical protein GMRT_13240 [Giardia muris]
MKCPTPIVVPGSSRELPGLVLSCLLDTGTTRSSLFVDRLFIRADAVDFDLLGAVFTLPIFEVRRVQTRRGVEVRITTLISLTTSLRTARLAVTLQTRRSGAPDVLLGTDYMEGISELRICLVPDRKKPVPKHSD